MPTITDTEPLRLFAEMRLDLWSGLPACAPEDADRIFGASEAPQSGSLGLYRRHPGRPATPLGVLVWQAGDRITIVGAYSPVLPDLKSLLGPPERVAPSRIFAPSHEQWIYGSRGLVAHIDRWAMKVSRVYGFAPMTIDAYLQSPLATVEVREIPLSI